MFTCESRSEPNYLIRERIRLTSLFGAGYHEGNAGEWNRYKVRNAEEECDLVRHHRRNFQPEQLEPRLMLTVTPNLSSAGLLTIIGDAADNDINLIGTGTEGSVAYYLEGVLQTTFTGVKSIKVDLGEGGDYLEIAAVRIPKNLTINMGSGNDQFDMDTTPDYGAHPDGYVQIGGNVKAELGGNVGDDVDWDCQSGFGILLNGNVRLTGAAYADLKGTNSTVVMSNSSIQISKKLTIELSGQGNLSGVEISMQDVNVFGTTTIRGSDQNDVIRLIDSRYENLKVDLKAGSDSILMKEAGMADRNIIVGSATLNGGADSDLLDLGSFNTFGKGPKILGFETVNET